MLILCCETKYSKIYIDFPICILVLDLLELGRKNCYIAVFLQGYCFNFDMNELYEICFKVSWLCWWSFHYISSESYTLPGIARMTGMRMGISQLTGLRSQWTVAPWDYYYVLQIICHLPVSCKSRVDRCGFLWSCKSHI